MFFRGQKKREVDVLADLRPHAFFECGASRGLLKISQRIVKADKTCTVNRAVAKIDQNRGYEIGNRSIPHSLLVETWNEREQCRSRDTRGYCSRVSDAGKACEPGSPGRHSAQEMLARRSADGPVAWG